LWCKAILSALAARGRRSEYILAYTKVSDDLFKSASFVEFVKKKKVITAAFLQEYLEFQQDELDFTVESNEDIVLRWKKDVQRTVELASPEVLGNELLMSEWVRYNPMALRSVNPLLLGSRHFMLSLSEEREGIHHQAALAIERNQGWTYFDAARHLMSDEKFVLCGVELHGEVALTHADLALTSNLKFMRKVYANGCPLPHSFRLRSLSYSIRKDKDCLLSLSKKATTAMDVCRFGSRSTLSAHPSIAVSAMSACRASGLQYLPDSLKDHAQVAVAALKIDASALQFISSRLRQERSIICAALDVRVPESCKLCFLMACNLPPKVLELQQCLSGSWQNLPVQDRIIMGRFLRDQRVRKSRFLLLKIPEEALRLIFSFAAWSPQRDVTTILSQNVDPEVAKEWVDDAEELYFATQKRLSQRGEFY